MPPHPRRIATADASRGCGIFAATPLLLRTPKAHTRSYSPNLVEGSFSELRAEGFSEVACAAGPRWVRPRLCRRVQCPGRVTGAETKRSPPEARGGWA